MLGLFLTDDVASTTQWSFPDTVLEAGGFLLVWTDNDENDGPLHTNFKLSSGGEEVGIYGRLAAGNEVIDAYSFGSQSTDISEGRSTNGGPTWQFFSTPTPGASNTGSSGCCVLRGDTNHDGTAPDIADLIYLVAFMFQEGPEPPCMDEANVNGQDDVQPDIADLIYLVSYMFQEGPDLAPCP